MKDDRDVVPALIEQIDDLKAELEKVEGQRDRAIGLVDEYLIGRKSAKPKYYATDATYNRHFRQNMKWIMEGE